MKPERITTGDICEAIVSGEYYSGEVIDTDFDIQTAEEAEALLAEHDARRLSFHPNLVEDHTGMMVTLHDCSEPPSVALRQDDEIHVVPHNTIY